MPSYTICGRPAFIFRVHTSTLYLYDCRSASSHLHELEFTRAVLEYYCGFHCFFACELLSFIANIKHLLLVLFILSFEFTRACKLFLVWNSCFSIVLFAGIVPPVISVGPWAKAAVQPRMSSSPTTREFPYSQTPICVWCTTSGWKSSSS